MALRFMDGFECFSDVSRRWDYGSGGSGTGGRYNNHGWAPGSNAVGLGNAVTKTLDVQPTWVVGFAFISGDAPADMPWFFVQYYDSVLNQVTDLLYVHFSYIDGIVNITITDGFSTIDFPYPRGLWQYFEMKCTPTATEFRVESTVIGSFATLSQHANRFYFRSPWAYKDGGVTIDDLYVCDGTGSTFNDYLGDIRIAASFPNALGDEDDYQPAFGDNTEVNHISMVNNPYIDYNEHGVFNTSGTIGATDLYHITPFQTRGVPIAVNVHATNRKDSVDSRSANIIAKVNSITYGGVPQVCSLNYHTLTLLYPINPFTNLPWTLIDINNMQIGIEVTA